MAEKDFVTPVPQLLSLPTIQNLSVGEFPLLESALCRECKTIQQHAHDAVTKGHFITTSKVKVRLPTIRPRSLMASSSIE